MPTIVQKKFISGDINDTYGKEYKKGTNIKDGTFTKEFEEAQIESGFLKKATTGTADAKPTTDAKADVKADVKAETKADADAKPTTDAKAETKAETKADAKAETKADAKADAKAETKATADAAKKEEGK